jgi:hypothetical protein
MTASKHSQDGTLFCYKTLHVSGIFSAHRQEFTVHPVLVSFMQVSDDRFQADSPDDGRRRCPKHVEFYNNKLGIISASGWLFKKK